MPVGVTVDVAQGSERPKVLAVPPGHDVVLLVLRSENSERVSPGGSDPR